MALLASSLLSNVFGAPCELDLQINAEPSRKKAPVTRDKKGDLGYIFTVVAVAHAEDFGIFLN